MLTIENTLILKRRLHLQSGQHITKTFKILQCRYRTTSYQIYNIYDNEINQQLTLKILIKNQQLSKQQSINQIKNHQLFTFMQQFVSLYDIYEDSSCIYLVMEKWGSTLGEMLLTRQTFTQYQVQVVFSQLLDIIVEMRKKNIAHGFIRLESLYIDVNKSHRIKLGEFNKSFNMSKYFQSLTIQQSNNRLSNQNQLTQQQQPSQKLLTHHHSQQQYSSLLNSEKQKSLSQATSISQYTSPQQLKFLKQKNVSSDYSKYLSTLYQNDIWAIGIVLYRLLMGRYPFQGQGKNNNNNNSVNNNNNKENKQKFVFTNNNNNNFNNFPTHNNNNKTDNSNNNNHQLLATSIKQCCYNFHFYPHHINSNNNNSNTNDSPISQHFQQLIKSILRPVDKRITLKQLLAHPLRLRQLNNVRGVNFFGEIPPLCQCDVIVSEGLGCLKHQVIQQWYRKNKKRQENSQEKKYEQTLKFLTPLSNFPEFPLYSMESYPFSIHNQSPQKSKYSYTWELNFSNDYQQTQYKQKNDGLKQSKKSQGRNDKNIVMKNSLSNKKHRQTAQSWYKQSSEKSNTNMNRLQRNLIERQKDTTYNNERPTTSNRKQRPKQILQQQQKSQTTKNNMNENMLISRSSSSHNFNIRNVNTLLGNKKTSDSNMYKKPTQDRNNFEILKKQNKASMYMPRQQQQYDELQQYGSHLHSSDNKTIQPPPRSIHKKVSNNSSPKSQHQSSSNSQSYGYYFNRFIETDTVNENENDDKIFQKQQNKKSQQQFQQKFQQKNTISLNEMKKNQDLCHAQQIIMKTYLQPIPLLVQQPQFILQYKFDKVAKSLGYVLNNGVGVVYCSTGKHIMGHNQTDYVVLVKSSAILNNNHNNQNINTRSNYQPSSINNNNAQNTTAKNNLLTSQQQQVYNNYLKLFGKRMVISNFSLWVAQFWQQGRVFIFLINNGSWQVTFQGKKTSKFFIIDQNQLIWTKGKQIQKPLILNKVRQIVQQKKNLIMKEKYNY